MDLYFQVKLHSTAAKNKIPHLMWREKANSHFIFFTICFTNLTQSGRRKDCNGFEGHRLYLLGNFSKVLKYSQEFTKASEKIIALQSIKRSKRTSSGMHTEQLINCFALFLSVPSSKISSSSQDEYSN